MPPALSNRCLQGCPDGSTRALARSLVVSKGSLVHIPPGVIHGARGRMRVLVVGVPNIAEDDYFEAPQ